MNTVKYLEIALARVKKGWNQRRFACDSSGVSIDANNPNAVSWCASGALFHSFNEKARESAYDYLKECIPTNSIIMWNDKPGRTQKEVIATFKRAIKLAKEKSNEHN